MEGITEAGITIIVVTDIEADTIIMADTDTTMDVDIEQKSDVMDIIKIKANIKTVADTKYNIENMIKRISTTKTIIKNTIKIMNIIKIESIPIKKQEIRTGQEIQVKREHVIVMTE